MNNYEREQLEFETTTSELCNSIYNQCLKEMGKLTFTLNIRKVIRRLLI